MAKYEGVEIASQYADLGHDAIGPAEGTQLDHAQEGTEDTQNLYTHRFPIISPTSSIAGRLLVLSLFLLCR